MVLATDASLLGWGATLTDPLVAVPPPPPDMARGFWSTHERKLHINVLELEALIKAIQSFKTRLQGRIVQALIDSQVVFYLLRSFKSTRTELLKRLQTLLHILDLQRIVLQPRWISTTANKLPNYLSRLQDKEDWQLNPALYAPIQKLFGPHDIDRFASALNG